MRPILPRIVASGAVFALLLLSAVSRPAAAVPVTSAAVRTDSAEVQRQSLESVSKLLKKYKSRPGAHYFSLGKVLFFGIRTGVKLKSGDDWAKGAASAFDGIASVNGLDYGECSDTERDGIEARVSELLVPSNKVLEEKEGFDTIVAYGALQPGGEYVTDVIIVMKDQAVFCLKGKMLKSDIKRTARRLQRQL